MSDKVIEVNVGVPFTYGCPFYSNVEGECMADDVERSCETLRRTRGCSVRNGRVIVQAKKG